MCPEAVRPERRQRQQHAKPQATVQSPLNLLRTMGKHRIHRPEQVAEVIGRGNQTGGSQVKLPFAEQVRHLRGEGEAPDAHGHHQGDEAGG